MNNQPGPNGKRVKAEPEPLTLSQCGTDLFKFDPDQVSLHGIENFLCLEDPEGYAL